MKTLPLKASRYCKLCLHLFAYFVNALYKQYLVIAALALLVIRRVYIKDLRLEKIFCQKRTVPLFGGNKIDDFRLKV